MSNALRLGEKAIKPLLEKYPDLVNEISTGGATPLHMCGMGRDNQKSTSYIIKMGGNIEAIDTYRYNCIFGFIILLYIGWQVTTWRSVLVLCLKLAPI